MPAAGDRHRRHAGRRGPVQAGLARRPGRQRRAGVRRLRAHRGGEQPVGEGSAGHRRSGLRSAPRRVASREPLLHHHADLLHQRGAAPRPRLHDDGGRCGGAGASPAGRRRVLPDRHRRARPEGRAGGPEGRARRRTQFADRVAQKFRDLLPALNISNDDFIRTTEPRHYAASQELWRRVRDRGFIYKGKYEGWYCTVDEVFVPDTQLQDGRCPICGNAVERIAEESYFFRLSAFQQPLLEHYRRNPEFVTPGDPPQRDAVVPRRRASRISASAGRRSSGAFRCRTIPAHVMYVWFDALTNYMTAVGLRRDATPSTVRRSAGRPTCT